METIMTEFDLLSGSCDYNLREGSGDIYGEKKKNKKYGEDAGNVC